MIALLDYYNIGHWCASTNERIIMYLRFVSVIISLPKLKLIFKHIIYNYNYNLLLLFFNTFVHFEQFEKWFREKLSRRSLRERVKERKTEIMREIKRERRKAWVRDKRRR